MGKKKPSTRMGQYKRASKQRASRKRRQNFGRRAKLIGIAGGSTLALIGISWLFVSGTVAMWKNQMIESLYDHTREAGFELTNVYLSGHDRLSKHAILHHSHLRYGQPILKVSLSELQTKLESLPQIRSVRLKRQLPGDLHIHIEERYPVALWREGPKLHLVDQEGVRMGMGDPIQHNHLPLIVGKGAPQNLTRLLALLEKAPHLSAQFDSAVYVGNRRWNLWLTNGILIKLPEENAGHSLAQLEALHQQEPLSATNIVSVDLRVPERMFIKPKVKTIQQASQQL